jgi:hypothetical protein
MWGAITESNWKQSPRNRAARKAERIARNSQG